MPRPPMTQAQKAAMHGYERGSVFDRMTEAQRKAYKAWLKTGNADRKVKEAQLSDRRYKVSRRDIAEV